MKKNIFIIILIILSAAVFGQDDNSSIDNDSIVKSDSILNSYTDDEFKKAVVRILQKGNVTNKELFIEELEAVRKGDLDTQEKLYGLDNINRENAKGMNGWSVALSGITVVFSGLILIMLTLYVFNFINQPRTPKAAQPIKVKVKIEEVPDDIIVAISTAVELYTRLYMSDKLTDLSFKTTPSESWKIKNKFVQGS